MGVKEVGHDQCHTYPHCVCRDRSLRYLSFFKDAIHGKQAVSFEAVHGSTTWDISAATLPNGCLFASTSDDVSSQSCDCEVYCCTSCECGGCCDSWAQDERVEYWMYDRPTGWPYCPDYCGYRMALIFDCGCQYDIASLDPKGSTDVRWMGSVESLRW